MRPLTDDDPRRAEAMAGPQRTMLLCDGSDEQALEFAWFAVLSDMAEDGNEAAGEVLAAWRRVLDDEAVLSWWQSPARMDGRDKPVLALDALRRQPLGVCRVVIEGQYWQPVDWGERGRPALIWADLLPGEVIDLVALDPFDGTQWRRRWGNSDMMPAWSEGFGLEADETFRLFETPLGWIAAGCPSGGLAVLDWRQRGAAELLRLTDEGRIAVVCDNDEHAARFRRRVRPTRPKMHILVDAGLAGPGR